jgi:hypothetical protein
VPALKQFPVQNDKVEPRYLGSTLSFAYYFQQALAYPAIPCLDNKFGESISFVFGYGFGVEVGEGIGVGMTSLAASVTVSGMPIRIQRRKASITSGLRWLLGSVTPKYTDLDKVNPGSVILTGEIMFRYLD